MREGGSWKLVSSLIVCEECAPACGRLAQAPLREACRRRQPRVQHAAGGRRRVARAAVPPLCGGLSGLWALGAAVKTDLAIGRTAQTRHGLGLSQERGLLIRQRCLKLADIYN